jgi:hypothetical protein
MRLISIFLFLSSLFCFYSSVAQEKTGCKKVTMLKPTPFLGTANEIIVLSDGSIWEDLSYKYLYLYVYNPVVVICPEKGKLYLERGFGDVIDFSVIRIK